MEFLAEYGMFLAKSLTLVVTVALIVAVVTGAGDKLKAASFKVIHLNEHYANLKAQLHQAVLDKKELKLIQKNEKKLNKAIDKNLIKPKVYVLDFNGDIKASQSDQLKSDITALLSLGGNIDEVVVKVESGGGMVHQYGFASSQLDRIKSKGIPLTVCVDKVAASGGYMMAVVADKIIAAPFAILGSIRVIAQLPNFNKVLKKNDIDFEVHTAGEYKRTLTIFGENTDKAREKFKDDLKDVHVMFKNFVSSHRPQLDVNQVANGDVWYGSDALKVNLIDSVMTSDEYLQSRCDEADVYFISHEKKKTIAKKLGLAAQNAIGQGVENAITKMSFNRWFL